MINRIMPFIMLATACILWGSSFVIAKFAMQEMSAFDISFWRSAMACIIFLPFVIKKGTTNISKKDLANFLLIGALTVPVTYILQFFALHYINAATAAVLIGIEPMTIACASVVILGAKLQTKTMIGSILAALGIYLVFADKANSGHWGGNSMVLLSTVVVGVWVALTKKLLAKFSTVMSTAYIAVFGFIAFLCVSPFIDFEISKYSLQTWLSIGLLTITSSVIGHLLWNGGLKKVEAGKAGIFLALEPVTGVVLAVILLHEVVTYNLMIGLLFVVIAMIVATWPNKKIKKLSNI